MKNIWRLSLLIVASVLMAVNINTFVHIGGLLPGGFSGITLLLQEILKTYLNIKIPFSLVYWLLNLVPAAICFRNVGKKFTLYSLIVIVLAGFLTDFIPGLDITQDILLCAIFGGIINGVAVCLCLFAGATSGGTDFISIIVSEKTGKSIWNYIFIGNCAVLVVFGLLFGWNRALYSIIFQYVSTQILNMLYKRYQKSTLLIVTDKPSEIVSLVRSTLNHDATIFTGEGGYTGKDRKMVYTVVSSDEVEKLTSLIKDCDSSAFVNILQTKVLKGNFFMRKND
ncbi:MAG: YitT family protein [Treponema sp.]|nr:YitT family protein [Treponema sp.]